MSGGIRQANARNSGILPGRFEHFETFSDIGWQRDQSFIIWRRFAWRDGALMAWWRICPEAVIEYGCSIRNPAIVVLHVVMKLVASNNDTELLKLEQKT